MVPNLEAGPSQLSRRLLDEAIVRERTEIGGRGEPVGISTEMILAIGTGREPSARTASAKKLSARKVSVKRTPKRRKVGRNRDVDLPADAIRSSRKPRWQFRRRWSRRTIVPAARARGLTEIERTVGAEAPGLRERKRRGIVMAIDVIVIDIGAAATTRRNRRLRDGHVRVRLHATRIGRTVTVIGIEIGTEKRRVSVSVNVSETVNGEKMARAAALEDTQEAVGRMGIGHRERVERMTRRSGLTLGMTIAFEMTTANERLEGRLDQKRIDREYGYNRRICRVTNVGR
jgi:hypothetical protein